MTNPTSLPRVIVKLDEVNPEPVEVIAQHLGKIADAITAMNKSSMKEHALVVLLADSSGVGRVDIRRVLAALATLRKTYLR